jgi:hypothetical protein
MGIPQFFPNIEIRSLIRRVNQVLDFDIHSASLSRDQILLVQHNRSRIGDAMSARACKSCVLQ